MISHFNVVYYVEQSATARKFKMGEGGVQIDWCQIKNISHVFFLTSVLFCSLITHLQKGNILKTI